MLTCQNENVDDVGDGHIAKQSGGKCSAGDVNVVNDRGGHYVECARYCKAPCNVQMDQPPHPYTRTESI